MHIQSSSLPNDNSTKGIEAIRLIQIFKDSSVRYPTYSGMDISTPEKQDETANEIKTWWDAIISE